MSNVILKYPLPATELPVGQFSITVPKSARLLSVGNQNGNLVFWYIVNPEEMEETKDVQFIGIETGSSVQSLNKSKFINTVQFKGGAYILHLFYL